MAMENGDKCISCGELQMSPWKTIGESARACQKCGFIEIREIEQFDPAEPKKPKSIEPYKPLGEPKHPNSIRYVARLYGITGPKQIQAFGSDRSVLKEWANKILEIQGIRVIIFEYTEVITDIIEIHKEKENKQCTESTATKILQKTLES